MTLISRVLPLTILLPMGQMVSWLLMPVATTVIFFKHDIQYLALVLLYDWVLFILYKKRYHKLSPACGTFAEKFCNFVQGYPLLNVCSCSLLPKKLFAKYFKKYFSLYFFPRAFYDTLGVPFFMCAGTVLLVPSSPHEGACFFCFSIHGSGSSCPLLFMLFAYVYFFAATSFPVGREPLSGPGTRSFFSARRVTFLPSPTGGAGRKARHRAPEYARRTHEGKERQRRSNTPPERKRRGWTRSGQLPRLCRARRGCFTPCVSQPYYALALLLRLLLGLRSAADRLSRP